MAKIKAFTGFTVRVPSEWATALDLPRHIGHADVLVLGSSKADVGGMLEDRRGHRVDHLVSELRLCRGNLPRTWKMLVDADILDPEVPGVFIAPEGGVKDNPVVRVNPDRTFTTVAYFRYQPGVGLSVEPVTA